MSVTESGTDPGLEPRAPGAPTLPQQISCLLEMATVLANEDPKAALTLVEQAAQIIRGEVRESRCPLSPAERRVALLAAGGVSNRQIADQLFLSPRTVECHLSHVYAKLGVRSKAELAAWWAVDGSPREFQPATR
jgi:DNA-binding CsgD family transcriptional regulator